MQGNLLAARQTEVPPEYTAGGRTVPSIQVGGEDGSRQLVKTSYSEEELEGAFVAVR